MESRRIQHQRKHRTLARMLLALATLTLRPAVPADAASPAREFSAVNNPNGVWSYGYTPTLGGPLILYTTPFSPAGLVGWNNNIASNDPLIDYNGTSAQIDVSTLSVAPGEIILHPGPDDEYSILRFTAPAADAYRVAGSFLGRDHFGTTTDVHLLVNSQSVFDGVVDGYGPGTGPDFDQTVTLAAGDTLDFAVGYGANGSYFDDTTALLATVSPTDAATPTVAVTSPPDGITVVAGSDLPLAASVADPGDVLGQVQFLIDGTPTATLTTAPFVFDAPAPTAPGVHAIQAVATDSLGRTATASIMLNVVAATTSAVPTAQVLTPIDGRNLAAGSTLTLTLAAAADPSTTLDHVSLYANGVLLISFGPDGTSLATSAHGQPTRRDVPAGVKSLFQTLYTLPGEDQFVNIIAVAFDKLGQNTVSKVASFHSTVTTDNAPLVAVEGVTGDSHFAVGSTDSASVVASDPDASTANAAPLAGPRRTDAASDAILAKLEYYLNDIKIGEETLPPFNFTFTPPAAGAFVLHAVATDGSGLASVSDPVALEADAPATVDLAVGGTGAAVEGGAKGVIIVSRTGDTSQSLTVNYKAVGTAVAGVDYKKLPGSIIIPAGAVKAKIKVKPINGSPNAGTLKVKIKLLAPADGSYLLGAAAVKLKLIGR